MSAKVKNSQVILRIVLPILTKFLQKATFVERFCKKWQNNPQNNLAIFHFCTQYFWCGLASLTPKKTLQLNYSMIYEYEKYLYFHEIVGELQKDFGSIAYKAQF